MAEKQPISASRRYLPFPDQHQPRDEESQFSSESQLARAIWLAHFYRGEDALQQLLRESPPMLRARTHLVLLRTIGADQGHAAWRRAFGPPPMLGTEIALPAQAAAPTPADPQPELDLAERGVQGPGAPLPHREELEHAFGTSFAEVRIYTGDRAANAASALHAEAYTLGSQIALSKPDPSPALLAHELAHVLQQRAGQGPTSRVGSPGDAFEGQAHLMAESALSGQLAAMARFQPAVAGAALQHRALQKYESGEHARLGCGPLYPYPTASGGSVTLPNGAAAYTGELVAFGDFYTDMDQLRRSPRQETEALIGMCRLEGVWFLARQEKRRAQGGYQPSVAPGATGPAAPAQTPDAGRLEPYAEIGSDDPVWDHPVAGQQLTLGLLRDQIIAQFRPAWDFFAISVPPNLPPPSNVLAMKATLGRRRFRGTNDNLLDVGRPSPARGNDRGQITSDPAHMGGDYLDLASNNISHFAPNSWDTWLAGHREACDDHGSGDPRRQQLAVAKDMLASHYLTDRFSSGHTINKEELMQHATDLVIGQGRAHGIHQANPQGVLRETLTRALNVCFRNPAVDRAWDQGVEAARKQGLLSPAEVHVLTQTLDKTGSLVMPTVAENVRDVLLGMPWRDIEAHVSTDPGNRSHGPDSQTPGRGAYQLGVGNLAALQVHDALNTIGFTVRSQHRTFRMQGDDHLTPEAQEEAILAVQESRSQVEQGRSDPDRVRAFVPTEGWIDPQWVRDFFRGRPNGVRYDQAKIDALCTYVQGRVIPLGVDSGGGQGAAAISSTMNEVCHRIMEILFTAPPAQHGPGQDDPSNTGLNIGVLTSFLVRRLPEMVPMAFASAHTADLPQSAQEAYLPRDAAGQVLPTAANDFRWSGDHLTFLVNVTGVQPGTYSLGIIVRQAMGGIDYTEGGQHIGPGVSDPNDGTVGAMVTLRGAENADRELVRTVINLQIGGRDDAPPDGGGRQYHPATVVLRPPEGGGGGDQHARSYVMVYADPAYRMAIGRSSEQGTGDTTTNPRPQDTPARVTGGDRTAPAVRAAGILGDAFVWTGTTVRFALRCAVPPGMTPNSTSTTVYIKTFNRDLGYDYRPDGSHDGHGLGGRDPEIGGVRAVTVPVTVAGGTVSEDVLFTAAEDNDGDTYIVVYDTLDCTHPLGRSMVQGTNRGTLRGMTDRNPATGVSGFTWAGAELRFQVSPPESQRVWLRWYEKNGSYDFEPGGRPAGGVVRHDDLHGGMVPIAVRRGVARAVPQGPAVNGDIYAVVYADTAGTVPLGRSNKR